MNFVSIICHTGLGRGWSLREIFDRRSDSRECEPSGRRVSHISEYVIRVEEKQTYLAPRRPDIFRSESHGSGAIIQESKMLLSNCVRTTAKQLLDLFTVGSLQGTEDADIARLELVRGMGW